MTRTEKLAEARRLLDATFTLEVQGDYAGSYEARQIAAALRLALDLIETSESHGSLGGNGGTADRPPPVCSTTPAGGGSVEPAFSPAPDFAAMGRQLGDYLFAAARDRSEYHQMSAGWLEANAHRFVTPAPAVVRDEAWYAGAIGKSPKDDSLVYQGDAVHGRQFYAASPSEAERAADILNELERATFGQDKTRRPAFDVEAFRCEVQRRCDEQSGQYLAGSIAADVAREMLAKGGRR